jgi:DNA-binding response OmpR family regulator
MEPHRASLIVLVAEDETLVGMALEDALTQAGYTVAGVFGTSSTALEWLEKRRPDAAVLDSNLRDGPCVELVRELKARGVPILLYSAFTTVPDEFRDLPQLLKPRAFRT